MKIFANLKLTKILQAQAWKARPPPLLFLMCFWKSLKSSSIVPILPVLPSFSNETPGEGAEAVDAFPRTQPAPCTCSLQQFCLCIFPAKEDPSLSLSSYILLLLWKKKKVRNSSYFRGMRYFIPKVLCSSFAAKYSLRKRGKNPEQLLILYVSKKNQLVNSSFNQTGRDRNTDSHTHPKKLPKNIKEKKKAYAHGLAVLLWQNTADLASSLPDH